MHRFLAALAVSSMAAAAGGVGPAYTAAGIVNVSNYTVGPFAPNSVLALFGTGLSTAERALGPEDVRNGTLPMQLNYTQVYVDNTPVPLFYVSEGQINFVVPGNQIPGDVKVRVVRQGWTGPEVTITLVDAAPALFESAEGYAVVTHVDGSVVTPEAPAWGDETVVVYATGLGKANPNPGVGEIPWYAAQLLWRQELTVTVGGTPVDEARILYAGVTPGSAGLYQINVVLPEGLGADAELRVGLRGGWSRAGVKLAVKAPQPSTGDAR
jgi:uncharacterized protein (TIGR03437 family)